MTTKILCTLGPTSMNKRVISRLEELGVDLFRINLSHTDVEDLPGLINFVHDNSKVPLCLDSEGAQVRTGKLKSGSIIIKENKTLKIYGGVPRVLSDELYFYPETIVEQLKVGDLIDIDFNSVLVQVIRISNDFVEVRALIGGAVGQNKAVSIDRPIKMSALTAKDKAAFKIGTEMGIVNFALSFINKSADVAKVRAICGTDVTVISKVECRNALHDLDEIIEASDAILIDRGDLSREIALERIPSVQAKILKSANQAGVPAYVATNLLESMIDRPVPTRAEVNDVFTTLNSGADGLVLAGETAIGKYPISCVRVIKQMIHVKETHKSRNIVDDIVESHTLLVKPHGGILVDQLVDLDDLDNLEQLPRVRVSDTDLLECAQISTGVYSPITGFMDESTLDAVLNDKHLPGGQAWTMPILLRLDKNEIHKLQKGKRVALTAGDNIPAAILDVSDIYQYDLETMIPKWFGTSDPNHPGVRRLRNGSDWFVSGKVSQVRKVESEFSYFELDPKQTRNIFSKKGWIKVIGFHTRNVVHKAHEYLQLTSLENLHADGLYISPIIGPKKKNDFLTKPIFDSYELLLKSGVYPEGKVVLGAFATYPRYCGPREAAFTALCRKNMGCSHFIVGRDHAGVGHYYDAESNEAIFDELGDIGVKPVFFDTIGYNNKTRAYEPVGHGNNLDSISGTEAREALRLHKFLPDWYMRKSVQKMLINNLKNGDKVFCK